MGAMNILSESFHLIIFAAVVATSSIMTNKDQKYLYSGYKISYSGQSLYSHHPQSRYPVHIKSFMK